jgi:hypothetical protein
MKTSAIHSLSEVAAGNAPKRYHHPYRGGQAHEPGQRERPTIRCEGNATWLVSIRKSRGELQSAPDLDPAQSDTRHRAVRAMLPGALGRSLDAKDLAAELARLSFAEPSFTRQMAALDPPN